MSFLKAVHAWTKCLVKRRAFGHQGIVTCKINLNLYNLTKIVSFNAVLIRNCTCRINNVMFPKLQDYSIANYSKKPQ